jgi:hypothetical protein
VELHELKQRLQHRFTDGLLVIVGSGMSASMGLPTMWALGEHLRREVPKHLTDDCVKAWDEVEARLASGIDIESALSDVRPESGLVRVVVDETARIIIEAEERAIQRTCAGDVDFAFRRLIPHLMVGSGSTTIVTTNYDRLIEFAAEIQDISVDTGFCGGCFGRLNPKRTRDGLSSFVHPSSKKGIPIKRQLRQHIALYKPHGSVDWFLHEGNPVRCVVPLASERLMITPGTSKYRKGYDSPFDYHRSAANRAIDLASGFLVIGYGFNDDQLETHLRPQLAAGKPCLILTKSLTAKAQHVVVDHLSVLALTEYQ